jgi:transposase InsO family protein
LKTWLSAAEIAALELKGMPSTKRGIVLYAERADWPSTAHARPRSGRGGGVEFNIALLPVEARADYVARHVGTIEVPASIARSAAQESGAVNLTGPATEARDARLSLLALADRYAAEAGLPRKRADAHFADSYNAGTIEVADWIAAEVKSLTARTLRRWRAHVSAGKTTRLAVDRAAARRDTGMLDRANGGEVKTFLLAHIVKAPQLTAHHLRDLAADRFQGGLELNGNLIPLPPVRTFQRALKQWRADYRNELASIRDPDGFKSKIRFAARVAQPAARLNEVWQIDASPADALTVDGRFSIYLCEDIYSRRLTGLVTQTPRAAAVGLLLRKAILAWGVPERIKTDNGSDFVARETRRLLAALAIEHELSAPFKPEQKGHIERAIGTLQRGLMRTLEGFVGHSVADRKVIEGRKSFAQRLGEAPEDMFQVALNAADLQQRVDEWCATVYGHAAHSGLKGQTPFAVAATYAGAVNRIGDTRALDMLLMPVAGKGGNGMRRVTKTGIRIGGSHYLCGALDVGDDVMVRMDPADLGRAYAYSPDGVHFLGELICPELAGIDPKVAIASVRAEQKRIIDEGTAPLKAAARKIKARDVVESIHRQAAREAGKLVELPRASRTHETPALSAAAEAANADGAQAQHAPEIAALAAAMRAGTAQDNAPGNVTPLRKEETPHQRWNRAQAIERALDAGEEVDADDVLWLGGYREGPEYRGLKNTYGVTASVSASPHQ